MTGTRTDFTNKIIEFALLLFKLLLKGLGNWDWSILLYSSLGYKIEDFAKELLEARFKNGNRSSIASVGKSRFQQYSIWRSWFRRKGTAAEMID